MTRELKLALIVGFLLVLLVSVLIADHLSTARKAQLDEKVAAQPAVVPITQPQAVPSQPIVITQGRSGSISEPGSEASPTPAQDPMVVGQVVGRVGEKIADVATGNAQIPPAITTATVAGSTPPLIPFGQTSMTGATQPTSQPVASTEAPAIETLAATTSQPTTIAATPDLTGGPLPTPAIEIPVATPQQEPAPSKSASEPEDRWHTIAAGDSAYSIAKKYYGKGEYWKQLAKYNGDRMGKNGVLRVGVRVKIPTPEKLGVKATTVTGKNTPAKAASAKLDQPAAASKSEPKAASSSGSRTYTVKKGDTLGHIAQRELGTTKRASEIMKLNKITDAGSLRVGQTLTLPAK